MLLSLLRENKYKLTNSNKIYIFILWGFLALMVSVSINVRVPLQAQITESPDTLIQESKAYYDGGQFRPASIALEKALDIYKNSGDRLQQARTLSLLSLTYEQLGKESLVEQSLKSSISILDSMPESNDGDKPNGITESDDLLTQTQRIRAQVLNRQGRWQLARGRGERSLETFKKAEFFYAQSDDIQGISISRLNQAQAWQTLGFSRRATKILDGLAQQLESQPPSAAIQLNTLNSLGNSYRQQGDLERSEQISTRALNLAKDLNLNSQTSKILLSLGNIKLIQASQARKINEPEQVIDDQQQALEYYQEAAAIATFPLDYVQAQLNQLSLLVSTNEFTQAENLLTPILNNLEQLPVSRQSIYARINFARSLMKMPRTNQQSKVTKILNTALAHAQNLADKRAESSAMGTLGKYYETTAQTKLAKKLIASAIAMVQNIYAPDLNYKWQWQLGRLLAQENKNREAIVAYTGAINDLQLLRFDLISTNPELQFSFADSVEPVYREFVDLLLNSPQSSQENLQRSVSAIEELKVAELDNLFRDACAQADSVDISQFDDNTAIIYPLLLSNRLELILKLPNQAKLYHYSQPNISEPEINNAIEQLQRSLLKRSTSPSQLKQESAKLYNWLIKPFASELEISSSREASQIKNLVFVLDGALGSIPMSALYDGQNYLIDRYSMAVSPGVQLVKPIVKPKSLVRDNLKVLLAGTANSPSFQAQKLAPLSNVSFELEGIAETIKRTEKLEDKNFLQANIQERINNNSFNVVHIATHGKFSSNLQKTYILDWDKAIGLTDLDQLLEAEDFSKAKAIDLLVLSACETATGDRRAALGLAGVAVRSGASSTIASLWQVNDASTAKFMIEFYRQLNNPQLSKAEALRNTQLKFIASSDDTDYNRPYHWASFILVGDWH